MGQLDDAIAHALNSQRNIIPNCRVLSHGGRPGSYITVQLPEQNSSKQARCGTEVNSGTVDVLITDDNQYWAFCATAPRVVQRRTQQFSKVRSTVPPKTAKIKILFSVIDGAERVFYVGGDRATPTEIVRLPSTTFIASAFLSNEGSGRNQWTVGLQYGDYNSRYSNGYTTRTIKGDGTGWLLTTVYSGDTRYKGHGFWVSDANFTNTIYTEYPGVFNPPAEWSDDGGDPTLHTTLSKPPYLTGSGTFTRLVGGSATSQTQSFYLLDGETTLGPIGSVFTSQTATAGGALYNGSVLLLPGVTKTDEYKNLTADSVVRRFYRTLIANPTQTEAIYSVFDDAPQPPTSTGTLKYFYLTPGGETLLSGFSAADARMDAANLINGALYSCSFPESSGESGTLTLKQVALTATVTTTTREEKYQAIAADAFIHSVSYHP